MTRRTPYFLAAACCASLLAGCTGGSPDAAPSSSTSARTSAPPTTTASPTAAVATSSASSPSTTPRAKTDPAQARAAKPYLDREGAAEEVERLMPGYRVAKGKYVVVVGDLLDGELKQHAREGDQAMLAVNKVHPIDLKEPMLLLAPQDDVVFEQFLGSSDMGDVPSMLNDSEGLFIVTRHLGGMVTEDSVYGLSSEIFVGRTWMSETEPIVPWVASGTSSWIAEQAVPSDVPVAEDLYLAEPDDAVLDHLPTEVDFDRDPDMASLISYAAATFVVDNFGKDKLLALYNRQQQPSLETNDNSVKPVLGISYDELERRFVAWLKRQVSSGGYESEDVPGDT